MPIMNSVIVCKWCWVCVVVHACPLAFSVAKSSFSGRFPFAPPLAMAQLPLPDYIATFLSRRAGKALVIVSPSFVPQNPLSLQEQLLVMTRRSNVMTRRAIEAEEVNEMYEMSEGNLQVRYDELAQRHQQVLTVVSRADYMRVTGLDRLFGN
jgi:hypothetical protein